LTTNNILHSS